MQPNGQLAVDSKKITNFSKKNIEPVLSASLALVR